MDIEKIGKSEKDQLYKKVIFEAFNNYPILLFTPIASFFKVYGINLENYLTKTENFSYQRC